MVRGRAGLVAALLFALVAGLSCGGGSSPAGPATSGTPAPTTSPTAVPTTAPPAPVTISAVCALGNGTLDSTCGSSASAYDAAIDTAITDLTKRRPDIFNLSEEAGAGNYRILKLEEYMAGVVQQLQSAGFCADAPDLQFVRLKKSNEFSEKYAIATSAGFVRRGAGAYRESCRPAIFPVDDAEYIDSIRVHFYGIRCDNGKTAPDNAEKILPVGCVGFVSATPKDKNNKDVDPKFHGSEIVWEYLQGDGENNVRVSDFPGQPFNKVVDALNQGYFTICATVKGVRGCFGFDVVP
jgi:hypothetical protein